MSGIQKPLVELEPTKLKPYSSRPNFTIANLDTKWLNHISDSTPSVSSVDTSYRPGPLLRSLGPS